jgi:hypothetical protein
VKQSEIPKESRGSVTALNHQMRRVQKIMDPRHRQITFLRTTYLFIAFFLLAMNIFPCKSLAAPYYQGKVLTVIVPYSPGGGYDRMARVLAKYLPKYLPGAPNVIVQNMPGAASMIGTNYMYNQAKPDGLTIATIARSSAFSQLVKSPGRLFMSSSCGYSIPSFRRDWCNEP